MRRRSRASSKPTKARSRKAKTRKAARHSSSSVDGQETEVTRFRRERDEALERETATSEVLRLISKSPSDLELVFRSILENATRICEAKFGVLHLYEDGGFRVNDAQCTVRICPGDGAARTNISPKPSASSRARCCD